eukprot:m.12487 g.12487  ORF g.12487 m.12487 type:complete len:200 (-) comp9961_c0_seq1:428-1027(-)
MAEYTGFSYSTESIINAERHALEVLDWNLNLTTVGNWVELLMLALAPHTVSSQVVHYQLQHQHVFFQAMQTLDVACFDATCFAFDQACLATCAVHLACEAYDIHIDVFKLAGLPSDELAKCRKWMSAYHQAVFELPLSSSARAHSLRCLSWPNDHPDFKYMKQTQSTEYAFFETTFGKAHNVEHTPASKRAKRAKPSLA